MKMVRGVPVSGRVWKQARARPHSYKIKAKPVSFNKSTWARKQEIRGDLKRRRDLERELKEQKRAKHLALKEKREEKERRRAENELRSQVVQRVGSHLSLLSLFSHLIFRYLNTMMF